MCETEKNSNSRAELLIATSNQAKLADFKLYLSDDYTVLGIDDIGIKLKIPEGIDSIEDNKEDRVRNIEELLNSITEIEKQNPSMTEWRAGCGAAPLGRRTAGRNDWRGILGLFAAENEGAEKS